MRIQHVSVDGFKNLSRVNVNFEKITALVSLNNFGKSNFLTAIDFAIDFIKAASEAKSDMMSNGNLMPMNKHMVGRDFCFEIEAATELLGKSYWVQYGFAFRWGLNEDVIPTIKSEYLRIKLDEKNQRYNSLIDRTVEKALIKTSETGRCSSAIKIDKNELVINKLRAYDDLFYSEIVKRINSLKFYMENNLDAKSFYHPDPFIRKGLDDVMVNASNLPRVIYKMQNEHPDMYDLLKNAYSQLFPHVEDIIAKKYQLDSEAKLPDDALVVFLNAVYVLYVKMDDLVQPVDFAMMSDGAKRVFMILTKIILAKISKVSLVAIEEPENSVHPSLFRAYISIISQLMDECRIVITSHSPYIISYMRPAWIRVGVERKNGVAEFFGFKTSGQKKLQNDAIDLNLSIGDYLFSMLADTDTNLEEYLECELDG